MNNQHKHSHVLASWFPWLACALLIGLSASLVPLAATAAASKNPAPMLKRLVGNGQFEEAYSLGAAAADEFEGGAEFDYFFGIAAIETGNYPEAIYALERVVVRFPQRQRVRLELARALYLAGNLAAAKTEFARVLAADPPPPAEVQVNITGFMARIDQQMAAQSRTITFHLAAKSGQDSNVNGATADQSIDTPLGTFDLSEDGVEFSDTFTTLTVGMDYREPLGDDRTMDMSFSVQRKINADASAFDLGIYSIGAGYAFKPGSNDLVRVGVRTNLVELDADRFQHSVGVMGNWTRERANGWVTTLTASATGLRYKGDPSRNTDQYLVAGTLAKAVGQGVGVLTLYGADEPARDQNTGKHNGRQFYGLSANVQYQLNPTLVGYAGAGAQATRYDRGHPVFIVERDDKMVNGKLGMNWLPLPNNTGVQVSAEVRHSDVNSNIVVFQHDRTEVEAGVRVQF